MTLSSFIPQWIRQYKSENFKPDLLAGFTVGVMLIPQGMAYAMLAGLPPVYGLYAATVPLMIYAIFGTSRHLSVGPVAIDSMMTAAGVSMIAAAGSESYIMLTITLAMMVGIIQFSLGASRLGVLINFLSHPVIAGFTSAAAIIIGMSQVRDIFGISMQSSPFLHGIITEFISHWNEIHWLTTAIGVGSIFFILLFKKYLPFLPGPLILMFVAIIIVRAFHLDAYGLNIIGYIPSGLPSPEIPFLKFDVARKLLPTAFAIALVSFMESMAVARSIQARHKTYRVDTNKELMAIGLANLTGAVFKSFPVSGGFSRSAVNDQAGARTGLASMVSALLVIATLLFLTPLFYYLPNAVLAAIIIVAIVKLINLREAKHLLRVDRKDFLMMLVTFVGTLFLGMATGIGIGVALSLAWIIYETSYPHHAELGRVPGTNSFRNVRRFKDVVIEDDVLIFRFDAPLFFANVDRFRQLLLEYMGMRKLGLKTIIIDMESVGSVDTSALQVFADTAEEIRAGKINFLMAEVKGPVRDKFYRSGLMHKLGEENFFITIDDALEYATGKEKEGGRIFATQFNERRRFED